MSKSTFCDVARNKLCVTHPGLLKREVFLETLAHVDLVREQRFPSPARVLSILRERRTFLCLRYEYCFIFMVLNRFAFPYLTLNETLTLDDNDNFDNETLRLKIGTVFFFCIIVLKTDNNASPQNS